jgi:HEAT repeats
MMKNTANITGTGNKSTQVITTPREKNPVSTFSLLILGVSFFVLVAVTITLYQEFRTTGDNGLFTYFVGMLAIAIFIWLSSLLALRFRPKRVKPTQDDKVLAALISTLQTSPDPNARLAAVKGLSELDLEESAEHMKHDDIDAILISALQTDPDSRVRSAAAEGLSVVELEKGSYSHTHDLLYGTLLKHGIAD